VVTVQYDLQLCSLYVVTVQYDLQLCSLYVVTVQYDLFLLLFALGLLLFVMF
jgi:hypothetical protein